MTPKLRLWLEIGGGIALLVVGAIYLHEYIGHQRDLAVAQATQDAQQTYQKQLTAMSADFDAKLKARDQQYLADKQAQDARFQAANTPAQLASLVSQLMGLKTPIQLVQPPPTPENPHPTPVATISTLDAPAIKDYVQACETCKLNLEKAKADAADRAEQAKLAQQTIDSLKQQRDTALMAAKGGTTWQRTIRALKYIAIGAGAGAVALCGTGHCKL